MHTSTWYLSVDITWYLVLGTCNLVYRYLVHLNVHLGIVYGTLYKVVQFVLYYCTKAPVRNKISELLIYR